MKIKLTISTLLFYVAYIMWLILYILNRTYYIDRISIGTSSTSVRIIIYTILFLKIIYDNTYSIKSILGVILIGLILIISFNSGESTLIDIILFIFCARNLKIRDVIKVTLFINIGMMVFIVSSSFLGIIKSDIWYREDGLPRYTLGYTYCTYIANYYFYIILMYLYLKSGSKFRLKEAVVILFINYIIYHLTDTRAVFYLIWFIAILAYGINFLKKPLKDGICNKLAFEYCFPIAAIVSILISINYNSSNEIYVLLNKLFSTRLALGQSTYQEFGISLLGQKIDWVGGRAGIERSVYEVYNFVDCSYLNIAINYGLIILILLCVGFVFIGRSAIKKNEKNICLVLLFLAIHSMTDPQLIELGYHPFLLMFGIFFSSSLKNSIKQRDFNLKTKIQFQMK